MNHHGVMQALAYHCYRVEPKISWAFVITDQQSKIIGWALIWKPYVPTNRRKICEMHVYIRKPYRRRGFGSKLVECCRKIADDVFKLPMCVAPHDDKSKAFYVTNGIQPLNWL